MGMLYKDDNVTRNLRLVAEGALPEFGRAMFAEIEENETPECAARCPVKNGDLVSTIRTTPLVIGPKTVKCGTTAGGPSRKSGKYVDYAIKVHEMTELYHPHGQAKYIESTYRESAPFILRRVADRVDLKRMARGRR